MHKKFKYNIIILTINNLNLISIYVNKISWLKIKCRYFTVGRDHLSELKFMYRTFKIRSIEQIRYQKLFLVILRSIKVQEMKKNI